MVKNTLTVGRIEEGFVLDHIQAGRSMDIYKYLHLRSLKIQKVIKWERKIS